MPGDFGNVAGNDLTLWPDDLGRGVKSEADDSGMGGGGGALKAEYVESRDFGREPSGLPARRPEGREAEFKPFEAGRVAVAGLGPNLTFGLYNESYSYSENDSVAVEGRAL
jgi:hypothetical protein